MIKLKGAGVVRANGHCTVARGTPLRATFQDAQHERRKHVPTLLAGYKASGDMIMGLSGSSFLDILSSKASIGLGPAPGSNAPTALF